MKILVKYKNRFVFSRGVGAPSCPQCVGARAGERIEPPQHRGGTQPQLINTFWATLDSNPRLYSSCQAHPPIKFPHKFFKRSTALNPSARGRANRVEPLQRTILSSAFRFFYKYSSHFLDCGGEDETTGRLVYS